jgi:hypothetical protein
MLSLIETLTGFAAIMLMLSLLVEDADIGHQEPIGLLLGQPGTRS